MAQLVIIPSGKNKYPKQINASKRCYRNFNQERFKQDAANINWDETINNNLDVNSSISVLIKKYNEILDTHAPFKKLTKKELNRINKPWLTKGILSAIKNKDKLYKKFLKSKETDNKNMLFDKFKIYRNLISNLIRKSKKMHYTLYFNSNINNIKKTWQGIKEIISLKSSSKAQPYSINLNGKIITDAKTIADSFNDYFSNIANKLSNKIVPSTNSFQDYLDNPNENSFFLSPVTEGELKSCICSMKVDKSNGPNSIPTPILKLTCETIAKPLTNIINNSFQNGIFPDFFKIAQVIPIYKKGCKLDRSNYRPISLLSNISKLFEKLMHNRLSNFLKTSNIIYELQFGFRKKHSTVQTLIDITEKIRKALDENKIACGVFVDLQKAFDTVNTEILLSKLNYYGVRGIPLLWFKSYLSERKQFVNIQGEFSYTSKISSGVPQGSILGPLLFLYLHK